MELLSEQLELRGVKNTKGKSGNVYYTLLVESIKTGEPFQFYCPDANVLPDGLKKCDHINLILDYNQRYKNLVVKQVEKVQ